MTAALDREHLAKVLGLLGSAHDGEVLAAGRHTDAIVRHAGVTWHDVLVDAWPQISTAGLGTVDDIAFCLQRRPDLNDREAGFVASVREQRSPLSTRQRNALNGIVDRLRRRAAAA
jgi:hypothetical protein